MAGVAEQIDWTDVPFGDDMREGFEAFHRANPHVLQTMVFRVRQLKNRGQPHGAIAMLFELARWDHLMSTDTDEPFKLNNNYRAYYVREIEKQCPDLVGFFRKRRSKSDD